MNISIKLTTVFSYQIISIANEILIAGPGITKKIILGFKNPSFRVDLKNGNWGLSYWCSIMFNPGLYF